jgi:hypothetical protein
MYFSCRRCVTLLKVKHVFTGPVSKVTENIAKSLPVCIQSLLIDQVEST